MRKYAALVAIPALLMSLVSAAGAQTTTMPNNPFGVTVTPKQGQTAGQQASDESACYEAAKTKSGFDPATLQQGTAPAAGSSDATTAAAINALAGQGGGSTSQLAQLATAESHYSSTSTTNKNSNGTKKFKRAFSKCMKGKGYKVSGP